MASGQGKGRNARKRKKREEEERRKKEEEEAMLQNTDKTQGDQNKVHNEEKDKSKEEVKGAMIREPMNKGLVEFIDRQILDLEEELECPVCLEVASNPPIFKCPDDHLICRWVFSTCYLYQNACFKPYFFQCLSTQSGKVPAMQS